MSALTEKELEHLAALSRIKLIDEDKRSLLQEFDSIIAYIDQLKKVKVSATAEDRVGALKNVTRSDDVVNTSPEDRERLLDAAPHRVKDFIAVKKIIEQ